MPSAFSREEVRPFTDKQIELVTMVSPRMIGKSEVVCRARVTRLAGDSAMVDSPRSVSSSFAMSTGVE